jgi:hypothetical protein
MRMKENVMTECATLYGEKFTAMLYFTAKNTSTFYTEQLERKCTKDFFSKRTCYPYSVVLALILKQHPIL